MLAEQDVRAEDFLQFVDHLNLCKAASPPFQVLNLAGTVLGFTFVLAPSSILDLILRIKYSFEGRRR